MNDRIRIERDDLYSPAVEQAIEVRRSLVERAPPEPEEPSSLRRWLFSGFLYLPLAGALGALLAWLIIEPSMEDITTIGGEIVLVEADEGEIGREWVFDPEVGQAVRLTVGRREVYVLTNITRFEAGADGQPAFGSWRDIAPGSCVEVAGEAPEDSHGNVLIAVGIRPSTRERAEATGQRIPPEIGAAEILLFPLTALLVAILLMLAEGASTGNWVRTTERVLLGGLITIVLAFLAYVPAGICMLIGQAFVGDSGPPETAGEISGGAFFAFTVGRSAAWACMGLALGLGMNLARSTKKQRRNTALGGMLGGALGGLLFGIFERVLGSGSFFDGAEASRFVGLLSIGLCVGVFVALVDQLAREAWLRVRTGPLAGKAFVLYKSPTRIGSAPQADIYLFKDAGIDPSHAVIHRVGNRFEIEDDRSAGGTTVDRTPVRRHRLRAGERIQLGDTILEFEERASRKDT